MATDEWHIIQCHRVAAGNGRVGKSDKGNGNIQNMRGWWIGVRRPGRGRGCNNEGGRGAAAQQYGCARYGDAGAHDTGAHAAAAGTTAGAETTRWRRGLALCVALACARCACPASAR